VGLSFIYRPYYEDFSLTLETCLRYIFTDSSIDNKLYVTDGVNVLRKDEKLDIDDALVGILSINYSVPLNENVSFIAGIGYQFDISKGDITIQNYKLVENKLAGIKCNLGISFKM